MSIEILVLVVNLELRFQKWLLELYTLSKQRQDKLGLAVVSTLPHLLVEKSELGRLK